jgi:hypothetical protein
LLIREEWCDEEIHKKNNLPEGDVGQTKDGSVSYRVFLFTGVAEEVMISLGITVNSV